MRVVASLSMIPVQPSLVPGPTNTDCDVLSAHPGDDDLHPIV